MMRFLQGLLLWLLVWVQPGFGLVLTYLFGSGDNVCDSFCAGNRLEFASCSHFSLECEEANACLESQIVIQSDSSLKPMGIRCDAADNACAKASVRIHSSDLSSDGNGHLNCRPENGAVHVCSGMQLTLVDSRLQLACGQNECHDLAVYLFGASTLELKQNTWNNFSFDTLNPATFYVFDDSKLIDNGVNGHVVAIRSPNPTCGNTTTESPKSGAGSNSDISWAIIDSVIVIIVGSLLIALAVVYVYYNRTFAGDRVKAEEIESLSSDERQTDLETAAFVQNEEEQEHGTLELSSENSADSQI